MKDSVLRGEGSTGHAQHSISSTSLKPRVSAHKSWMAAKSGPLRSKRETREKNPEEKKSEKESEEKDPEELGEKKPKELGEKKPEESEEKDPERESREKIPQRGSREKIPQRESRGKKPDDDIENKADLSVSMSEDVISSPEGGGDTACCPSALSEPLIKCYITPHEGVRSSCPYTIEPPQLVLPAKSQSSITVTFTPSLEALNVYGRHVGAYGIGFLSVDSPKVCTVHLCLVVMCMQCDKVGNHYNYSETSLIRHLYNPTFSLIRPLIYEVQSPYLSMVRGTP